MPDFHMMVKEGNGTILGNYMIAYVILKSGLLSPERVNGVPYTSLSHTVKLAASLLLDAVCVRARVQTAIDEHTSLQQALAGKNFATGGRSRPGVHQSLLIFMKQAKILQHIGNAGRKTTIQVLEKVMIDFQKLPVRAERLTEQEYTALKTAAWPL